MFIQELYKSLPHAIRARHNLETVVKDTLSNLGLNHDQSFINFLKDQSPITHNLFIEANNPAIDSTSGSLNALAVIARATLMLRISIGSASVMLQNAGISKLELDFFWERFGVDNGFWERGNVPVAFNSLWDDIKDSVDDVVSWTATKNSSLNLFQLNSDKSMPEALNFFKQFHRAALWGIAI